MAIVPDFKDWHELESQRKLYMIHSIGKVVEIHHFIKFESVNVVLEGVSILMNGWELVRCWKVPMPFGKESERMALAMEDGSWVAGIPADQLEMGLCLFRVTQSIEGDCLGLSILTKTGWVTRKIAIK